MAIYGLLTGVILAAGAVLVCGVRSESINRRLQRWFPTVSYDGQGCLLAGLALLAAFVLGLFTMYVILEMF